MKKALYNWLLTLAVTIALTGLLEACSAGNNSGNQNYEEQAYLAHVALLAEQFNQTLPKDEDMLVLTEYKFDPQQKLLTLTHRFTTEDIAEPNPNLIKNVRNAMIEMMGHNLEEMEYIQHGISFKFDYYSANGDFLFTTSITPDDFNGINALKQQ